MEEVTNFHGEFITHQTSAYRNCGILNSNNRKIYGNLVAFPRLKFFIGMSTQLSRYRNRISEIFNPNNCLLSNLDSSGHQDLFMYLHVNDSFATES